MTKERMPLVIMVDVSFTSIAQPVPEESAHKTVTTDGAILGVKVTKSFGAAAGVVIDIIWDVEYSTNCEDAKLEEELFVDVEDEDGVDDEPVPGVTSQCVFGV